MSNYDVELLRVKSVNTLKRCRGRKKHRRYRQNFTFKMAEKFAKQVLFLCETIKRLEDKDNE